MRMLVAFVFVLCSVMPSAADACSISRAPAELARRLLAHLGPFDAEVEVRVIAVSATAQGGWQAIGQPVRTVSGAAEPDEFQFGESERVISSCGKIFEPAVVGETWTLYLKAGKLEVFLPSGLVAGSFGDSPRGARSPGVVERLTLMPVLTRPR